MTIYTKVEIGGIEYTDIDKTDVISSIGTNNASSSFAVTFGNEHGKHNDDFDVGNEIVVWADKNNLILPTESPISQWKLNDNLATTDVIDSVGGNNGTLTGGNSEDFTTTGKINNAFEFDGDANDHVDCSNDSSLTGDIISFGGWIKHTSSARMTPFGRYFTDYDLFLEDDSGAGVLFFGDGTNHTSISLLPLDKTNNGEWQHIFAVINKITGNAKVYQNGILKVDGTGTPRDGGNPTRSFKIGHRDNGNNEWIGSIDDVRVYDIALTAAEVSSIYNLRQGTEGENDTSTKLFTGIVEDIKFLGKGMNEKLTLKGRDYTARLMDSTVEPEVYNNVEISLIVKDIIDKYVNDITYNNVDVTTRTLDHITFNQVPVYDALRQLAEFANFYFYIDVNKDLNFKERDTVSSGVILNNTNVTKSDFKETDKELFNKVWVYGDRILTGIHEDFTTLGPASTGSEFGVSYRPHNTAVAVNGSVYQGGVFEMTVGAPLSGTQYLVDFDGKNIVFVSGTQAGDNVPLSGNDIDVDYNRSTPIIKYGEDRASISQYGPHTKVIQDKSIITPQAATDVLVSVLSNFAKPLTQGRFVLHNLVNLVAGNTIVVDMPFQDINNEAFTILQSRYVFTKSTNLSDQVLEVKVSKKIKNFLDTIKELMLALRKLQSDSFETADVISRLEFGTGSFGVRVKDWEVRTRTLGSSFILGTPNSNPGGEGYGGILGSVLASGINFLGDSRTGFTIQQSGGIS